MNIFIMKDLFPKEHFESWQKAIEKSEKIVLATHVIPDGDAIGALVGLGSFLKKEGFEADDVLGTISKYVREGKWSNEDIELYILSGDKDLLQLVSDNVKVCLPQGNFRNLIAYDRIETKRKFKMYPEQIVDYKAMAGDASDNIPGVKGVGSKTALERLLYFIALCCCGCKFSYKSCF